MAYGIRYKMFWLPEHDRDRSEYGVVQILENGYEGAFETLTMTPNLAITRDFQDWEESHMIGMTCEFEIVNDKGDYFALFDLMVAKERKYLVQVLYIIPTATYTLFVGYLNTEVIQQKYLHKQIISLVASSHLSRLEYTYPASIDTIKDMTFIDLISEMLKATGSTDLIYTNLGNIRPWEDLLNYGTGETFLNMTGINTEAFWENNVDRKTSLDILTGILKAFNLYLYWWNNTWYIEHYACLWQTSKTYIAYSPLFTYNPLEYGVVVTPAESIPVKDVGEIVFTEMTQTLSVTPGDKIIEVKLDLVTAENMTINDFTKALPTTVTWPKPGLREWLYYSAEAHISWVTNTGGLKLSYNTIESAVKRTVTDPKHVLDYAGLYTKFRMTYTEGCVINIKYKFAPTDFVTYTRNGNLRTFTGNYEDYLFRMRWYIYCEETDIAITQDPDLPEHEYSVNYIGAGHPVPTDEFICVTEVDGSSIDVGTKTLEVNINIPLDEVNGFSGPAHPYDQDYHFVVGILAEACRFKDSPSEAPDAVASTAYIGDVYVTVTGMDDEPNVIEGSTNEDFLNKRTIDVAIGDCGSWQYKNSILRANGSVDYLQYRTTQWYFPESYINMNLEKHSIAEWLLYYKFRLHNIPRAKLTGEVKENTVLRPFSMFTESKQNDKKYILTGYRHYPVSDSYEVQLDEYDNETDVNLIFA